MISGWILYPSVPSCPCRRASYVDKLAFFTIGEPPITANLTVVYKKNAFLSPAARTFIDLIKKQYQAFDRMA